MRKMNRAVLLCASALTLWIAEAQAAEINPHGGSEYRPTGKGSGEFVPKNAAPTVVPGSSGNGIGYHGGPVLTDAGGTNVYLIWYGNWSGNTATTILPTLMSSLTGSSYFNINTTYYNRAGAKVANIVNNLNSTTDTYSQGSALSDSQVKTVVSNAITSGRLPSDANGVYFVLTSADVNETSGFCTQYCGWHTHGKIGNKDIKYSFVGNPDRCPSACEAQSASSPNNNPGADGMASTMVHELEEAVTDPDLNAWYDSSGRENADKCAWTFGTTTNLPNGSISNITLGSIAYLIQQNWVNANGGYCSMSYP